MRAVRWAGFAAIIALGTLFVTSVIDARVKRLKSGSFLVDVTTTVAGAQIPVMRMLTTLSDTGQMISTDTTDRGFLPPALSPVLASCATLPGGPQPGERNGPIQGTWRRDGLTARFVVLSQRFDPQGIPVGFLRARGTSAPQLDGTIGGSMAIDYLGAGGDPLTGQAACSFDAAFLGRPIPAEIEAAS